jgi:hypothetical protein
LEVGLVELKLYPNEFYELTMHEFVVLVQGERKKSYDNYIEEWRRIRSICYSSVMPHFPKGKKIPQEKWWPLPGDKGYKNKGKRIRDMSPEEQDKLARAIEAKLKKLSKDQPQQ